MMVRGVVIGGLLAGIPAALTGAHMGWYFAGEGGPHAVWQALNAVGLGIIIGAFGFVVGGGIGNVVEAFIRDYQEHHW